MSAFVIAVMISLRDVAQLSCHYLRALVARAAASHDDGRLLCGPAATGPTLGS